MAKLFISLYLFTVLSLLILSAGLEYALLDDAEQDNNHSIQLQQLVKVLVNRNR